MTPQLDLSNWLNDAEVCARLGVSPRWIDREADAGRLHPLKRPVKGRRPERVFSTEEVEARIQRPPAEVARREAVAPNAPPAAELAGLPEITWPAIFQFMERAIDSLGAKLTHPEPPALWVHLKQAAAITGLSVTALRKLIDRGDLVALRDRAIKVRREGLAGIDVAALAMRPKKRGKR